MRLKHTQRGILGFLGGIAAAAIGARGQSSANEANVEMARETNQFNAAEAVKARDFNAAQAQLNRDYQSEMSNSAYQRATSDLTKAGLNPMLAYTQGGAGTPGGATASAGAATGQAARVENVAGAAVQSALAKAQIQNITAQTAATAAQAAKTVEETKNVALEGERIGADTQLKRGQYGLTEQQQRKLDMEVTELVERMKRYPLDRNKIRYELDQIAEHTNLTRQQIEHEVARIAGAKLSNQHSFYGLNESKASAAFFKEGAIGEQNKALRLIVDTLKGAAAAGSSWRK